MAGSSRRYSRCRYGERVGAVGDSGASVSPGIVFCSVDVMAVCVLWHLIGRWMNSMGIGTPDHDRR